jgi:hypothetical protein
MYDGKRKMNSLTWGSSTKQSRPLEPRNWFGCNRVLHKKMQTASKYQICSCHHSWLLGSSTLAGLSRSKRSLPVCSTFPFPWYIRQKPDPPPSKTKTAMRKFLIRPSIKKGRHSWCVSAIDRRIECCHDLAVANDVSATLREE